MTHALTFPTVSTVGSIDAYIQAANRYPMLSETGGTPFVSESGREYYKWKLDNNGWVQASEFNTFAIDTARHNILVEDANGCTVQLMFDWNNDVNFIDFQDTIYNTCTLDRINLFNADPGNDWWEEVGLDQGFLLDYSWYGTPTEHIFGNQVWEYSYWTSDSGWQIAVFQAVQQIRDPKLYWSSTNNTADEELRTALPAELAQARQVLAEQSGR